MKIVYILATLMFLGIFIVLVCSLKILNDMNSSQRVYPGSTAWRFRQQPQRQQQKTPVKPSTLPYVIGTYLGLTFFVVGGIGSIIAVFQVGMRRF
jgi:hypothetical protein